MISQGISIQSFSLTYTQSTSDQQDLRTNLKSLIDAIKSGNVQDAQTAYGKITDALSSSQGAADSDGDSDASSASDGSSESPFKAFLDAIGKSLSSNDIGGAQKALSDFEANRPKAPPPGGQAGADQLSGDAKNAFIDLIKSIRSGDLSGAKTSLATLLDQQTQNATQSQSPLDTFLSQVGSALDNGDLDAAQKALQSLAQQQPQGAAIDFSA